MHYLVEGSGVAAGCATPGFRTLEEAARRQADAQKREHRLQAEPPISLDEDAFLIAAAGSALRVATPQGSVSSYAVAGPSVTKTGSVSLGGQPVGLFARGPWVLTVLKGKGLRVVDLTVPSAAVLTYEDAVLDRLGEQRRVFSRERLSFARPAVARVSMRPIPAPLPPGTVRCVIRRRAPFGAERRFSSRADLGSASARGRRSPRRSSRGTAPRSRAR